MTDTLHIVWTMVDGVLMLLAMGFAAAAFGKRFRIYSIATMLIMVAFGALTGALPEFGRLRKAVQPLLNSYPA